MAEIRPLTPADAPAAHRLAWAALSPMTPAAFAEDPDDDLVRRRGEARIVHCATQDPGGAWAAEVGGELAALALAILREGVWGLSLFATAPDHQGRGLGARVLERALAYGDGARGGIILSSAHPRATRHYHRAGFALRPAVAMAGPLNASRIPDGLRSRPGDVEADAEVLDRASRHVRGASHRVDVAASLAADVGFGLLVCEDRGYVLHRGGSPSLLAAVDEEAATDLLWSAFAAAAPGTTVHFDFVTAGQDWAVAVGMQAGLELSPDGPVFVRGALGPMAPYLPSGAWL